MVTPWGDVYPGIAVETHRPAAGMVAVAIGGVAADPSPEIARSRRAAGGQQQPRGVEAAGVGADVQTRCAGPARGDAVDRAAQRSRSEAQGVRSAIDLEMIEEDRLQLLEIAIVVSQVDRHAILQQRQPTHVKAARDARSADRDAHFLAVTRLKVDARRKGERVAQRHDGLVGIVGIAHDIGTAGRAVGAALGLVGLGGGGDDDGGLAIAIIGGGRGRRACARRS